MPKRKCNICKEKIMCMPHNLVSDKRVMLICRMCDYLIKSLQSEKTVEELFNKDLFLLEVRRKPEKHRTAKKQLKWLIDMSLIQDKELKELIK